VITIDFFSSETGPQAPSQEDRADGQARRQIAHAELEIGIFEITQAIEIREQGAEGASACSHPLRHVDR
jgi:hypothetical protein